MNKKLFGGYVLAGGKSSRMGADKAFLQIGEKTFIENAVEILEPNCEQVKVVLNRSQTHFIEKLPAQIPYIFDAYEDRGAPGGIHAALKDCKTEFAVILAVDLPFVPDEIIKKLCEIAENESDLAAVVPLQNNGKFQPLCAAYRVRDCLPPLRDMLESGEMRAVRDFLEKIPVRYVAQKELNRENERDIFFNVNSAADFQRVN